MTSRRIAVREAAIIALNTDRPSDVPEAGRRRYAPGMPLEQSQIAVFFAREVTSPPTNRTFGVASRSLNLAVQCAVPVVNVEDADDAIEPLLNWAVKALALSTLGGLAVNIREETTDWSPVQADVVYMIATILFVVEYQTKRDDMEREA